MTLYNFSAGPAVLPAEVLQQAQAELCDWNGTGLSVMEMSHRDKPFMQIAAQAEADIRELLAIPSNYKVLFLQGGASLQFAMVPMNLLGAGQSADYIDTGIWSQKAMSEAKKYGSVREAGSGEASCFRAAPTQAELQLDPTAAYLHYTPNETIGGVEFGYQPESGSVPLVADYSSTILSRPLEVSRFGLIYAGAQKNIGPAGLTLVIIRDDLLGRAGDTVPTMLNYQIQAEHESMYNTPPTYGWYLAGLVFQWLKRLGGLTAMAAINERKANRLYAAIDGSDFYANGVDRASRSWMNIPFTLANPQLDATFLAEAKAAGLLALKGHRLSGGMRASIYNAMPEAGVETLIQFMVDFERRYG